MDSGAHQDPGGVPCHRAPGECYSRGVVLTVRPATPADLEAIRTIQVACPEAAQWFPADYLKFDALVADVEGDLAGFLVGRDLAEGETEILNVAVDSRYRRRGVARALVECFFERHPGYCFLEVRASNSTAQCFYQALGFQVLTCRPEYYWNPMEAAVVMKGHS